MMMQCLIAGGLDGAWSEGRDSVAARHADEHYHPNRGGLYEVPLKEYTELGFPKQYDGKLIKVMAWGMVNLAVADYRVVLMRRDPEEIRQSYEGFFETPLKDRWFADYSARMDELEKQLENRRDVRSVTTLSYRDVVEHPLESFTRLKRSGWDISACAAASQVDAEQYRFRLERLTVGI